jgi:hypothetical protein
VVNIFDLDSIHLGAVTFPHMATKARFITMGSFFSQDFWKMTFENLKIELQILFTQHDAQIYNSLPRYGYFYRYTTPIIAIGMLFLLPWKNSKQKAEKLLLLAWIVAAFFIGVLETSIINRINLIFIPLIICAAIVVDWCCKHIKLIGGLLLVFLFIGFILFSRDYFGDAYRQQISKNFFAGILPSLQYAQGFV